MVSIVLIPEVARHRRPWKVKIMARRVGYLATLALCATLPGCRAPADRDTTSQSETQPAAMTYKITLGMKLSAALSTLADADAEDMCLDYDMVLSRQGGTEAGVVSRSGCYRLPDDTAVWLMSTGPRDGRDERFVLTSIALGGADDFAKARSQRDKFVKHRVGELTMSNDGVISFAPHREADTE